MFLNLLDSAVWTTPIQAERQTGKQTEEQCENMDRQMGES